MLSPLRILFRVSAPLLALAPSATLGQYVPYEPSAGSAPQCGRISDPKSTFQSGLRLMLAVHASYMGEQTPTFDSSIFDPIDQALPALSECVAETNPLELLMALVTSPDAVKCINDTTTIFSTPADEYATAIFNETVCPAVKTLAPCLTDVLLPAIESLMARTNGCCDALNDQIQGAFGAPLRATVSTIVRLLDNALCSERSSEYSPPEKCGDSLVQNWVPSMIGDDEKAYWSILNSFQIPNDQVCLAAASEVFTTTTNRTQQYGSPDVTPFGSCYSQVDLLTQYVRDLPLWTAGADPYTVDGKNSLFEDGRCLKGTDFLSWAEDENGTIMKAARAIDDIIAAVDGIVGGGAEDSADGSDGSEDYDDGSGNSYEDPYGDSSDSSTDGNSDGYAPSDPPSEGDGSAVGQVLSTQSFDEDVPTPAPSPALRMRVALAKKAAPPMKIALSKKEAPPMKVALAKKTAPAMKVALAPKKKVAVRAAIAKHLKKHAVRRLADSDSVAGALRDLFQGLGYFADQLCFHLPNGVQCEFLGELLTQAYTTPSTSTYPGV